MIPAAHPAIEVRILAIEVRIAAIAVRIPAMELRNAATEALNVAIEVHLATNSRYRAMIRRGEPTRQAANGPVTSSPPGVRTAHPVDLEAPSGNRAPPPPDCASPARGWLAEAVGSRLPVNSSRTPRISPPTRGISSRFPRIVSNFPGIDLRSSRIGCSIPRPDRGPPVSCSHRQPSDRRSEACDRECSAAYRYSESRDGAPEGTSGPATRQTRSPYLVPVVPRRAMLPALRSWCPRSPPAPIPPMPPVCPHPSYPHCCEPASARCVGPIATRPGAPDRPRARV